MAGKSLTVFYDGACPLCAREIAFYRRRRGADAIHWQDISRSPENTIAPGLSKDQALARFHVQEPNGAITSGGQAFAKVWANLPGFRIAGRVLGVPPLSWMPDRLYDLFLRFRPRLQRFFSQRQDTTSEAFPDWLIADLRSDHAGETGAVTIYRGILAVSRDPAVRAFAEAHLYTEQNHLNLLSELLPKRRRSLLLPLWRLAGFLTGALPAVFGSRAVFATIEAVETFVDRHYAEQIDRLNREGLHPDLAALLQQCREDELHHRDEARDALDRAPGPMLRLWCRAVGGGSAAAVALARRI